MSKIETIIAEIKELKLLEVAELVKAMEEALGRDITFDRCAENADEMLRVRKAVNNIIAQYAK